MSAQSQGTSASRPRHLPAGCDAETAGAVETPLGTVHVRIRRWPWPTPAGATPRPAWARHQILVETPRARAAGEGFTPIGDVEDLSGDSYDALPPVTDLLTAYLRAAHLVERAAASRVLTTPGARQAPDRAPEPSTRRPARRGPSPSPTPEPAGTPGPSRRPTGQRYRSLGHRLHAVLGAAGVPSARHKALAAEVLGRAVASLSDLTPAEARLVERSAKAGSPSGSPSGLPAGSPAAVASL